MFGSAVCLDKRARQAWRDPPRWTRRRKNLHPPRTDWWRRRNRRKEGWVSSLRCLVDNALFLFIYNTLLKRFFSRWALKQGWDVFVVCFCFLMCVYTCQAPHQKRSPKARVSCLPFAVWWIILLFWFICTLNSQAPHLKRSPKARMSCLQFAVWWVIHVFCFIYNTVANTMHRLCIATLTY